MNYQKEPTPREGATRSNPFAGFEAYQTAPLQAGLESDAVEERDEGPRGGDVDAPETYSM